MANSAPHVDPNKFKVFAGRSNPLVAQHICDYLCIPLGRGRAEGFPDSECIVKIEEDVRGKDVFVVQSTCNPVNEHLMELFIWIDCLRRASAKRITAVIPYFGYARQDRKDEGRTPITARLVANLIERAGADRVVSIDLHAAQVQGFFDIPLDHLHAGPVFRHWFKSLKLSNIVFVSPDVGNVKRAQVYANMLGGEICIIDKRRKSGSEVIAEHLIGDVRGKNVIMVDDMISTAGTMVDAVKMLQQYGVGEVYMAATHGVFAGKAIERLSQCPIAKLAVTDTIPLGNRADGIKDRLCVLSVADLLGEAMKRIHMDESVSSLFKGEGFGGRALSE